jgi:serine-type D-Ala-D-Ala carboxypeptidase/endopeptidase
VRYSVAQVTRKLNRPPQHQPQEAEIDVTKPQSLFVLIRRPRRLDGGAFASGANGVGAALLKESISLSGPVMWIMSGSPGMVLVVVRGNDVVIEGYGETAKGNDKEPDGESLIRLGSISKTFTGEMLASLSLDGTVHLTDPLKRYAGSSTVPSFGQREMTLLDLATHSAGLPREIGDVPPNTVPFTWTTKSQRWDWLANYQLRWEPGRNAAYSNVGFDLLADALATVAGKPYADLLRERFTSPLGMSDTGVTPTKDQCDRLMPGSGICGPGPCVETTATGGAGGVYSTGADMALWIKYNLVQGRTMWEVPTVAHAVYRQRQSLSTAIGFDEAGPMAVLGLAWVTMAANGIRPMIVAKSGGGGGFMTYIAFARGNDVGVFVAVNKVDFGMFYAMTQAANNLSANLATR